MWLFFERHKDHINSQQMPFLYCRDHGLKIEVMAVLETTPANVRLECLAPYIESALEQRTAKRHQSQLLRGLIHSEHIQIREERIRFESIKVALTEEMLCELCHKKFRSVAEQPFVRLPSGQNVHYACREKAIFM